MRTSVLAMAILAGCGTSSGSEKGDTGPFEDGCIESSVDLAPDEASPLGYSVNDVLAFLAPGFTADLAWADGGGTTITFAFGDTVEAAQYRSYTQDPESDVVCEGATEGIGLRTRVVIATADGRLAYDDARGLYAPAVDDVRLSLNPMIDGTGCAIGDGFELQLDATFGPGGTAGVIECQGTGSTEVASW